VIRLFATVGVLIVQPGTVGGQRRGTGMTIPHVESSTDGANRLIHSRRFWPPAPWSRQCRVGALVFANSLIGRTLENGNVFAERKGL